MLHDGKKIKIRKSAFDVTSPPTSSLSSDSSSAYSLIPSSSSIFDPPMLSLSTSSSILDSLTTSALSSTTSRALVLSSSSHPNSPHGSPFGSPKHTSLFAASSSISTSTTHSNNDDIPSALINGLAGLRVRITEGVEKDKYATVVGADGDLFVLQTQSSNPFGQISTNMVTKRIDQFEPVASMNFMPSPSISNTSLIPSSASVLSTLQTANSLNSSSTSTPLTSSDTTMVGHQQLLQNVDNRLVMQYLLANMDSSGGSASPQSTSFLNAIDHLTNLSTSTYTSNNLNKQSDGHHSRPHNKSDRDRNAMSTSAKRKSAKVSFCFYLCPSVMLLFLYSYSHRFVCLTQGKSKTLIGKYVVVEGGRYKGELGFVTKGSNGYYSVQLLSPFPATNSMSNDAKEKSLNSSSSSNSSSNSMSTTTSTSSSSGSNSKDSNSTTPTNTDVDPQVTEALKLKEGNTCMKRSSGIADT
jgi:hypothetical protein